MFIKTARFVLSRFIAIPFCVAVFLSATVNAAVFHIDSEQGSNAYDGSAAMPWRNFENVTPTLLGAGDQLLLKRGGLWQGGCPQRGDRGQ